MSKEEMRKEHDFLGERDVPVDALWGIHTLRAVENFTVTSTSIGSFPELVRALALVKRAAARANHRLGCLSSRKRDAIERACEMIAEGNFDSQFIVDAVQGGAGTSTNMNANEVIANLALSLLGSMSGDYATLHPNNDVNMSQSTNDVYPTALRLAMIFAAEPLSEALHGLATAFSGKATEFAGLLKIGRTQLQDAVPMTLGQEFEAFRVTVEDDLVRLREAVDLLKEINLGATAIGTGINTDQRYSACVIRELALLSGHSLVPARNLIQATSDVGAFVQFSGVLKRIAVRLSKICNDLRLLSSGPQAGLGEIRLPAVQAGSSIMPGKVNPVIPEVVNQVAYIVIGHDLTVTMCGEGGQLQLNAFEPTIGYCLMSSLKYLAAAVRTLTERCVLGIEADGERCRAYAEQNAGLATVLGPSLGYETAARIAKRVVGEKRSVSDIVLEEGLLSHEQLDRLLQLDSMIAPAKLAAFEVASSSAQIDR